MSQQIIKTLQVSKEDFEALIRIRDYFKENKDQLSLLAFDVLSRIVEPINQQND